MQVKFRDDPTHELLRKIDETLCYHFAQLATAVRRLRKATLHIADRYRPRKRGSAPREGEPLLF